MEIYLEDIEVNHITLSNSDKISKRIGLFLKSNKDNVDDKQLAKLEVERQALMFGIDGDQIIPKHSKEDYDGNVLMAFPDLKSFKAEAFQHIKERFEETENHVIKAHLGHFLHLTGERHQIYLQEAHSKYAMLIDNLLTFNKTNKGHSLENEYYHQINFYLRQYEYVSVKLKSVEGWKALLLDILKDDDHQFLWYPVFHFIIASKKVFTEEEIESLSGQLLELAKSQEKHLDKISHYKLGEKLNEKIHKNTVEWKELQAISYEELSLARKDLAAIEFANKAARLYEITGNLKGAKRMADLYRIKSKSMELSRFSRTEDVTDFANETFEIINSLKDLSISEIIEFLSVKNELIISLKELEVKAKTEMKENRFNYLMGHQIIDSNGHPSKHYSTPDELFELAKFTVYGQDLQRLYQYRVDTILQYLITDREDWTAQNLITYLKENTWYGDTKNLSTESNEYRTIELLAPGFINYFDELKKHLNNPDKQFNFTLCLDSLTLKIEGILRDICTTLEIKTFAIRPDDNNRNVTKELDINLLIRKTKLINFLGQDLIYFMKYVLVERSGFNLRNNVAHSFLKPPDYKVYSFINMLIIILLRLSVRREQT